jgi:hypothetical protein
MKAILRNLTMSAAAAGLFLTAGVGSAATYERYTRFHPRRPAPVAVNLNAFVLGYAESHLGEEVGRGECWDLADAALKAAGADTKGDGDCVWGKAVALGDVTPGDVLQFENAHFEHSDASGSFWSDYPHHTAIVSSVKGRTITMLNQNVNGDKKVQYSTINLDDLKRGTVQAYQPQ